MSALSSIVGCFPGGGSQFQLSSKVNPLPCSRRIASSRASDPITPLPERRHRVPRPLAPLVAISALTRRRVGLRPLVKAVQLNRIIRRVRLAAATPPLPPPELGDSSGSRRGALGTRAAADVPKLPYPTRLAQRRSRHQGLTQFSRGQWGSRFIRGSRHAPGSRLSLARATSLGSRLSLGSRTDWGSRHAFGSRCLLGSRLS